MGETAAQNAIVAGNVGNGIGDCIEDTFSVSTPGGPGSPVICGTNTGYHSKFLRICSGAERVILKTVEGFRETYTFVKNNFHPKCLWFHIISSRKIGFRDTNCV